MAEKILVYWRDIPSQVIIKRGRVKGKAVLSDRFQEAIDRAAMRAGKGGTDDYIEEWRREATPIECAGDLNECAHAEAAALEAHFTPELLDSIIRNKGLMPAA